jgi:aryl-alcohol dehydrogenase (NADP+)
VALLWLWSKPYMASPIIGATQLEQLDDAAAATAMPVLSAEEISALEKPYQFRVSPEN